MARDPMKGGAAERESGGPRICGAKTRSGGLCQRTALPNGRCSMHGGKSPSGIKASNFKHGRRSKALAKLDADIADRVNAPDLVNTRRGLAVLEGVLAELNELKDVGDGPEFRETARKMLDEAIDCLAEGDEFGARRHMNSLQGYLRRGVDETRALMGLATVAEKYTKGADAYWRTALLGVRAVAPEDHIGTIAAIMAIVEEETDRDHARRILERADREVCRGALGVANR